MMSKLKGSKPIYLEMRLFSLCVGVSYAHP
nr:MAG TPA: hypothetical protein [Bacteriophage sp.]